MRSGVGDARHPRIGDQGNAGSGLHRGDEFFASFALIVGMAADGRHRNPEVGEQFLCLAGIFAGDAIDTPQDAQRPPGDVFKISDGGRDNVKTRGQWFGVFIGG